ncbi:MAG: thiopeptide-type bacteriocin biosynthesis protein [Algibacter sp.]
MNKKVQRNFILGDSWLYYKIYTGPKTSDIVLTEIIKPVAEQLIVNNFIDKWFFIRYADPKHHIRVRFHYTKPEYIGVIINSLYPYFKKNVEQDLIWKIQTDTYQRELERYGKNTMELAESLFYYDSKMVVDFIDMIEGVEGEELRWLFSLRVIDSLLNSFKYTDEEKKNLLISMSVNFRSEFDSSKFLGKQLNDKFRIERKKLEAFMEFKKEGNLDYVSVLEAIEEKEINIANTVAEILKIKKENNLQIPINNLMSSSIHMLMNRLFKSKNRLHEMVCYDFLCRYYKSIIARKKGVLKTRS